MIPERLLTLEEVAEILQVAPRTVRQLPIERSRIGKQLRYKPDDVTRYINAAKENAIDGQKKNTPGVHFRRDRNRWEHRKYFHGQIFSGLHATEEEARAALAAVEKQIEIMKRVPTNSLGAVIIDFLLYSKRVGKSDERIKALIYNFKKFIVPFFGEETSIAPIDKTRVEEFIDQQTSRGVKNSTVWHYLVDLAALFNYLLHRDGSRADTESG